MPLFDQIRVLIVVLDVEGAGHGSLTWRLLRLVVGSIGEEDAPLLVATYTHLCMGHVSPAALRLLQIRRHHGS